MRRCNLLLALGIVLLGIVTPLLQLTLANLYFRKGHIWSRVLNKTLDREKQQKHQESISVWMQNLRHIMEGRLFH